MIKVDWARKFLDTGRYRYRFMRIDLEPWREQTCPICEKGFGKAPNFYFMSYPIHWDCVDSEDYVAWVATIYDEMDEEDSLLEEDSAEAIAQEAFYQAVMHPEGEPTRNDWY